MREAVRERGLEPLVASDGRAAAQAMKDQVVEEGVSLANFDPLMSAHWAIFGNAMRLVAERYNQSPMLLTAEDPAHPELQCPVCALNHIHEEHDRLCKQPNCNYPKGERYEWMIATAADAAKAEYERLKEAAN